MLDRRCPGPAAGGTCTELEGHLGPCKPASLDDTRNADKSFVDLCAELIKLGARTVKCGQYEATFVPVPKINQRATPEVDGTDPLDRFPRVR